MYVPGTFRTSPIPSLHIEAGEMPLNLPRQQLSTLSYSAQTRQTKLSTVFSAQASVIGSKSDQTSSQLLATGCNKASWFLA